MEPFLQTNWSRLFRPEMSLPEIVIRGTLVYLALCLLLRIILRRQAGKLSLSDLLVVAIVAGVCRNPLVRDAYSVPDGIAVVAVVLAWSYALDWLSYHSPFAHKLLHPEPVVLIRDGTVLHVNLRRELMTESQLLCQLRQNGIKEPSQVAQAIMEGSGQVSVIRKQDDSDAQPQRRAGAGTGKNPGSSQVGGNEGEFLRTPARLQQALAWHERQIAAHQQAKAEIKEILQRAGGQGWQA